MNIPKATRFYSCAKAEFTWSKDSRISASSSSERWKSVILTRSSSRMCSLQIKNKEQQKDVIAYGQYVCFSGPCRVLEYTHFPFPSTTSSYWSTTTICDQIWSLKWIPRVFTSIVFRFLVPLKYCALARGRSLSTIRYLRLQMCLNLDISDCDCLFYASCIQICNFRAKWMCALETCIPL